MNESLRFCFRPMLRLGLHLVDELWNTSIFRVRNAMMSEEGRPDIIYFVNALARCLQHVQLSASSGHRDVGKHKTID